MFSRAQLSSCSALFLPYCSVHLRQFEFRGSFICSAGSELPLSTVDMAFTTQRLSVAVQSTVITIVITLQHYPLRLRRG